MTAASAARRGLFGAKVGAARAIGRAQPRAAGAAAARPCPGRLLLRLAPDAIARLGAGLDGGSTVISATNGKTTTAGMIAAALRAAGRDPVHNRAGSNMSWGVATALLEQRGDARACSRSTRPGCRRSPPSSTPRLIVLGNLFRDQLDRYGELEHARRRVGGDGRRARRAAPASSSTPTTR